MRWAGIDEAGYGPNLGPLVMTAVVAEGPDETSPDLWNDLAPAVCRAGGPAEALWVDDSKRLYKGGAGLDRLEAAALAIILSTGRPAPATLAGLLDALGAGSLIEAELHHWLEAGADPPLPLAADRARERIGSILARKPLEGAPWRITAARTVVVGPTGFNAGLATFESKAAVHFAAFSRLLRWLWDDLPEGESLQVRADKHGGRHYYLGPLGAAIPEAWIDRGVEGPDLSAYSLREGGRRLDLRLQPRADADDGFVALASILSKSVREWWMAAFNAHWCACLPGLKPTAGYPGDASRFRAAIEAACLARGLGPEVWWRSR